MRELIAIAVAITTKCEGCMDAHVRKALAAGASKQEIAEAAGVETAFSNKLPRAAYDYTVEATGSGAGLSAAVAMTRARGTIVLKSTVHGAVALDAAPVIVNEITLVGSRCGRFEPALKLLRSGKLRLDETITDQFSLKDAPRAFERAQEPGVLKVLLWR
jgi:alcohol dehydrogenase